MRLSELVAVVVDAATGGQLRGKTLLQKRIYFLSRLLDESMGFDGHYYGPYSGPVEAATADAVSFGFLEKRTLELGVNVSTGYGVVRYDFELTEDGQDVVEYLDKNEAEEVQQIRESLERLEGVDLESYNELSIAAKVDYLAHYKDVDRDITQLIAAGKDEGWSLEEENVEKALRQLEELGLTDEE